MTIAPSTHRGPIAWMAQNPIAANLLMALLIIGGILAAINVQKEVEPAYQLDVVEVEIELPKAAPGEVESSILLPVENAVRGVQGIREILSSAREGRGTVTIELVSGTDRQRAFQDIDQAVTRIRTFPRDAEPAQVSLQSRQREVMQVGIYGDVPLWELRRLAEQLRDQLLNHEKISQVELGRALDYVTHVEVPLHNLRKYDLQLQDIANAVGQSSQDIPAGIIETPSGEVVLRLAERKVWSEQFAGLVVVTDESGANVTLGDLATTVADGFEEGGFHSRFNQTPSMEVEVYRVGNQSPLEVAAATRSVLAEFAPFLPPEVKVRIDGNAADDYEDRLSLLIENGVLAIVIVLAILSLFLQIRLAFWVMVGMVVSFVGGIVFLPFIGVSINMVSMFGFLVVLGIVVDDAIVVGENVHEHRQLGKGAFASAVEGTRQVARPVIFSILTTVVTFLPLLFMPGETGLYWHPLPVVVIVVLLVSLFEALFILPSHLGHTPKQEPRGVERWINNRQKGVANRLNQAIDRFYRPLLVFALRYRYVTVAGALSLLVVVGAYGISTHMGMVLMPEVAAHEIEAGVRLPVGTTPKQAAKVADQVTDATLRMFEKHDLYRIAYGVKTNVRRGSFVDVEIVMKPPDERNMTANQVIALWRHEIGDIDGVSQITFEAERGPGGHRQDISIALSHSNIDVLADATQAFVARVNNYDNVRDVNDNYDKGKVQFDIQILPQGRLLGLTAADVGQQLRNAFFGALALRQLRGTNEFEVRVKLPKTERESAQLVRDFVLRTPEGMEVPLEEVAVVGVSDAFNSISRRDGRRAVTVSMDVEPKSAITQVLQSLNATDLPQTRNQFPGLTWTFQGSQAEMRESTDSLWTGFLIAIIAIYSLLAVAFRSYSQPLIILCAIPFGIIGAVIGHILLGFDLSLVSLMGMIALSGVVVNDSLIMIDFANENRGERSAFDAILQAGQRRFRPILLTTLTTFAGLTPIILESSNQARHLIPMAISLGFGILFATAIILVLVPSLYLVFDDFSRWWRSL